MECKKGLFTIPTDSNYVERTKEIIELWGADALRNSDGTTLDEEITGLGIKVYSTYFPSRGDNEWARANPDEWQHFALMTDRITAVDKELRIFLLDGYFTEQVDVDCTLEALKYMEVIDRTSGEDIDSKLVNFDEKSRSVVIQNVEPMHEYTVSFFGRTLWDSTQMYNYITNNWTKDKDLSFDPRYPKTKEHVKVKLAKWLKDHGEVNVVRFTTFFYHFALLFNNKKKEKFVDWFGYSASASPLAFEDFRKEYGYPLRLEDIVDKGYFNSPFRVPSKKFIDYMNFIQKLVSNAVADLVKIVHDAGKEAMMFLGDTWIGVEPYGKLFPSINLDAVVGSVGGGVTIRMLSDIEGVKYTEGRFLPYFFPDTFHEGGKPTAELNKNWLSARRAIMRKPIDRIGYGGYLKLADKFPDFMLRVKEIADEFRYIYSVVKDVKPFSGVKVAILNSWGKLRSWQSHMVAHELWYKQIYSYQGILEALSGSAIDVTFLSFGDVRRDGVPKDVDVIINAGAANTAFSGAEEWDAHLTTIIKQWIYNGGGFIGVGEPSARLNGGKYFQLSSALGVERELGLTLSHDKYNWNSVKEHFITADADAELNLGEFIGDVYALDGTQIVLQRDNNVMIATNNFGKGTCVYLTGLPFSIQNCRLLYRTAYYAANKTEFINRWFSSNPYTECNYYPDSRKAAVVNNSDKTAKTVFYDGDGKATNLTLKPMEIKWIEI